MNSELSKVDITYGTKRHGERVYKNVLLVLSMSGKKQNCTFEIIKTDNEVIKANVVKTNSRVGLVVFSNCRLLFSEISYLKILPRQELSVIPSAANIVDKSLLSTPKTFHLILNKAHAVGKKVSVFLKSGETYSGVSKYHDFDSVQLVTKSGDIIIMYDAVKRIVPLEPDGSIAE
ncbi:hypothetical protein [Providencia manganoxydans]|uniref:hypothetical protein n=2 Tax=Providencia manganoxydans TaxID=2923283 RepID=UPI0032D9CAEA